MIDSNKEKILYEDVLSEEYLDEMAQFKPVGSPDQFNILLSVNPEKRIGNCYFKVYNNSKYSSATKVARISFTSAKLITGHAEINGKKEWLISEISSKIKKEIIDYLNSRDKRNTNYTIWTTMRFEWNELKNIQMDSIEDYTSGKYDKKYKNNPDYIPYNLQMPDYNNLN